ncbi:MAG: FeoA family protein [Elusimicrobiota bacterium]
MKDSMNNRITVADMNVGSTGNVVEVVGGSGIAEKLETMGVRVGSRIKKISQHFNRGPVIISCGNTQIAFGYGMAKKIIVEIK